MLYTYTHFVIHILLKVSKTDEILTKKAWNFILNFE
jgi:hypothetical protein